MKYKFVNGMVIEPKTFVTGETPIQAFGICGGRPDFDFNTMRVLWAGCLDAPDHIPNGKVVLVQSESSIVPGSVPRY